MPKFHSTAAHRLVQAEATIQRQAEHILELEVTITKLKVKLASRGIKVDSTLSSRPKSRSSLTPPSPMSDGAETASYLQGTASSRAKARLTETTESSHSKDYCHTKLTKGGNHYVYIDGRLILDGPLQHTEKRIPHYAVETEASCQRRAITCRNGWGSSTSSAFWDARNHHYPSDTEETEPPKKSNRGWVPRGYVEPETPPSSVCDEDEPGHPENPINPIAVLRKKSRYNEKPWDYSLSSHDAPPPASYVYIPSKFTFGLLRRALVLAQEAFFATARECWPDFQRAHFPGGPQEVKFGRSDMEVPLTQLFFSNRLGGRGGTGARAEVSSALSQVADLRNAVCHYDGQGLRKVHSIDSQLSSAHELAICLLDTGRAHKIRGLRDALVRRAEEELREIENCRALIALPECRLRWKMHQQMLFDGTGRSSRSTSLFAVDFPPRNYPVAVLEATEEWEKWGFNGKD